MMSIKFYKIVFIILFKHYMLKRHERIFAFFKSKKKCKLLPYYLLYSPL